MKKIVEVYRRGITIHIWKFGVDAGWYTGEFPALLEVCLLEYQTHPKVLHIFWIKVIYFQIAAWVDFERGRQ